MPAKRNKEILIEWNPLQNDNDRVSGQDAKDEEGIKFVDCKDWWVELVEWWVVKNSVLFQVIEELVDERDRKLSWVNERE